MQKRSIIFALFCCLLFCCLFAAGCIGNSSSSEQTALVHPDGLMEVHFLDVGQGDSTLIKTPKENILIDGGEVGQGEIVAGYLKEQGVRQIDILLSTHPHSDHIGGLQYILSEIPVKMVLDPVVSQSRSGLYSGYKKIIAAKQIELKEARAGDSYKIDGGSLKIVYCDNKADEINNTSIVALITYGKSRVLFTGDLEKEHEVKLGEQAELLQVGHHGSRTSSCEKFLKTVKPRWAVISCGEDNEYGHPHSEVLERLGKMGVKVYRTDISGDIIFTTDGVNWTKKQGQEEEIKASVYQENNYIGNKQSKVYHLSSCRNKPKSDNQIILATQKEAEQKGYKPHSCVKNSAK